MLLITNGCRLNGKDCTKRIELTSYVQGSMFNLGLNTETGEREKEGVKVSFGRDTAIALSAVLQDFIKKDE